MNTSSPARWFRLYAEFAYDPKVQMLSEAEQRRYIMLLCLRCSNGDVTLQDSEVAFQLRISINEALETKRVLLEKGLICDAWQPVAWDARQFSSDRSADRVRKHRENAKLNASLLPKKQAKQRRNVTVTAPETETETETEKNKSAVAPPDGVSQSVWQDFQKLRKTKRAPITETAIAGIIVEAEKAGWTIESALQECCARGWQSFKAEWVNGKQKSSESVFAGAI